MNISFDPPERVVTLLNRRLDFADSGEVFAGRTVTIPAAGEFNEVRFITAGHLIRPVRGVGLDTARTGSRRIISMGHAHEREERRWFP